MELSVHTYVRWWPVSNRACLIGKQLRTQSSWCCAPDSVMWRLWTKLLWSITKEYSDSLHTSSHWENVHLQLNHIQQIPLPPAFIENKYQRNIRVLYILELQFRDVWMLLKSLEGWSFNRSWNRNWKYFAPEDKSGKYWGIYV